MWSGFVGILLFLSVLVLAIILLSQYSQGKTGQRLITMTQKTNAAQNIAVTVFIALFALPLVTGLFQGFGAGLMAFPLALVVLGYVVFYVFKKSLFKQAGWSVFASAETPPVTPDSLTGLARLTGQLFGLLILVLAFVSYLERYNLVYSGSSDIVPTASWFDVTITAKYLILQAVLLALWGSVLLFGRFSSKAHWGMAAGLVAVYLIGQPLLGGVLRSVYIKPNELILESPYISNHIDATRRGFDLNNVTELTYDPHTNVTSSDIASATDTLANIRVWDYRAFNTTNNQLQALRTFYSFDDADIDRYQIDGQERQLVVSARELNLSQLPPAEGTQWIIPFTYTHSYGLTAAPANAANNQGQPDYLLKDIPPVATDPNLIITEPEMYFSEAPFFDIFLNTGLREVDPSIDVEGGQVSALELEPVLEESPVIGIPIDSLGKRLMAAFDHGFSANVLFSKFISSGESNYVVNRSLQTRLIALAPFVEWDSDPYPVIRDNGEITWLVDGYTTTSNLPLAARFGEHNLNYIRNSIKASVNAATGETHLYLWDANDPLIQTWQKVFPGLLEVASSLPADLQSHVRYPIDLFKLQTGVYNRYHVSDPLAFYSHEDIWRVPNEILSQGGAEMPMDAYYNIVNLPGLGTGKGEFTLLRPAAPFSKENMTAMYAGRSDAPYTGQLVVYRLPTTTFVAGPSQIATRIDQDPELSKTFTLWNQEGSEVIRGGMYLLPVGQTVVYVQPIYLQARNNPIPELRLVVLATNNQLVFAPTAQEALQRLVITKD
jgi:uncharacterized membrane protein (UPF0182 family)